MNRSDELSNRYFFGKRENETNQSEILKNVKKSTICFRGEWDDPVGEKIKNLVENAILRAKNRTIEIIDHSYNSLNLFEMKAEIDERTEWLKFK